ncbi:glycosyltransferase family 2 protein [Niveibacterium sp.]|uniref:glycosyltransferase family 2 protein n=1 Tax=Niveibacterium sp. TaxID=2017444 RepID=UPI0035B3269D
MSVLVASSNYLCSLVIPTKDGGELFKRAIDSLKSQSIWPRIEFIVIDSGSRDDTVDAARAAGAKIVEIDPKEFNHGATRDMGIAMASSDIVILMVQDAVANGAGVLEALISPFGDDDVAGVYARQIPQESADIITKRNLNGWLTGRLESEVKSVSSIEWYNALSPMERYFLCNFDNVCSAIRKSAWERERFGRVSFGEDIDWSERILKRGLKIVYEPAASVIHSHDRPLSYEYKRTYVCHRKLFRQFGLHLVPTRRGIYRAWMYCNSQDIAYIWRQPGRLFNKIVMSARVPVLNLLAAIAQYRAARDESAGTNRRVEGV